MNENTKKLIELIRDNPELPIVPMVDYEVVGEDCGKWCGDFGTAHIGEYIVGNERVYFREDEDIEGALNSIIGWSVCEDMTREEAQQEYDTLPWVKAIIVDINLPKEVL